ncbi:unnamed protein product, partial [Chrysoparadoxa australica]
MRHGIDKKHFLAVVMDNPPLMEFIKKESMSLSTAAALLQAFSALDTTGSGHTNGFIICDQCKMQQDDEYNIRVLRCMAFKSDPSGKSSARDIRIHFDEFLVACYAYMTCDESTLARLTFDVMAEGKGYLTSDDLNWASHLLFHREEKAHGAEVNLRGTLNPHNNKKIPFEVFLDKEKQL